MSITIEDVIVVPEHEPFSNDAHRCAIGQPFFSHRAILGLAEATGSVPHVARLSDGEPLATLVYFLRRQGGLAVAFSRGRFGHLGLVPHGPLTSGVFSAIVDRLRDHFRSLDVDICSVIVNPLCAALVPGPDPGNADFHDTSNVFVADLRTIFDSSGNPIFEKYVNRSFLSRNLNRAKRRGLVVWKEQSQEALDAWYRQCHLPRMAELRGRVWDWDFLRTLCDGTDWTLYSVGESPDHRIGGSLALRGGDVTEIFMMSTPKRFLETGANYILSDFIYRDAYDSGRRYINWQGSNPVEGGLADFKKAWGAEVLSAPMFGFIYNEQAAKAMDANSLRGMFPEIYVLPYECLGANE